MGYQNLNSTEITYLEDVWGKVVEACDTALLRDVITEPYIRSVAHRFFKACKKTREYVCNNVLDGLTGDSEKENACASDCPLYDICCMTNSSAHGVLSQCVNYCLQNIDSFDEEYVRGELQYVSDNSDDISGIRMRIEAWQK